MFCAEKLQRYLQEQGMTQEAFGREIGVSGVMVGYLMRGVKQPSAALLCRIAQVTGYSVEELWTQTTQSGLKRV